MMGRGLARRPLYDMTRTAAKGAEIGERDVIDRYSLLLDADASRIAKAFVERSDREIVRCLRPLAAFGEKYRGPSRVYPG